MLTDIVRSDYSLFPTVLACAGVVLSLLLAALGVLLLMKSRRIKALFYFTLALLPALYFIQTLIRTDYEITCCRPLWETLLLFAGILIPQFIFAVDGWRTIRRTRVKEGSKIK